MSGCEQLCALLVSVGMSVEITGLYSGFRCCLGYGEEKQYGTGRTILMAVHKAWAEGTPHQVNI